MTTRARGRRANAPGWRHPNFVKKPVLDGGPALRIDVKVDGSLSDAGLCYAVLGALWGGPATKAPSYTCTLTNRSARLQPRCF